MMKKYKIVILRRNIGEIWTTINDWFIDAFRNLGHEVIALNIPYKGNHQYNPYPSITATNRYRLNKIIKKYQPDVAFIIHGGGYWTREMIQDMKKAGMYVVYYNPDDPMIFDYVSREIAPYCDLVLTFPKVIKTYEKELNIKAEEFFYCVDPDIVDDVPLTALEKKKYGSDIVLTGAIDDNRKKIRRDYLYELYKANIGDVAYYGPSSLEHIGPVKPIYRGKLKDNKENSKVNRAAKIVFHYTQELTLKEQKDTIPDKLQSISGRVLDATAAGALLMTNYFIDLEKAFDVEREVVVYDGIEDAIEKACYYLTHEKERNKIALAGQDRALREHTVMERATFIIRHLQDAFKKSAISV